VIEGPELGWFSVWTVGGFLIALVALWSFVRYEASVTSPMLDPRLFKVRGFATGAAGVTLVFFNMFAMFFLLTQYLQFAKGYTPLQAGLRVLPNAAMLMIVTPQMPKVMNKIGVNTVVRIGFALGSLGFVLLALSTRTTPYGFVAVALVLTGSGIAMVMPGSSQHIVGSLPLAKAGVGSAMNDVTREVGGALGIAVAGSVVASVYRGRTGFAEQIADPAARELAKDSIGKAVAVADRALAGKFITAEQATALKHAAADAFTHGTRVAFFVVAGVAMFASFLVGGTIPARLPSRQVPDAPPGR
jgi:hypothetical protein